MASDIYKLETYDFKAKHGDVIYIPFEFFGRSNVEVDMSQWNIKSTFRHPQTKVVIPLYNFGDNSVSLKHDHVYGPTEDSQGIYKYQDANLPEHLALAITKKNQLLLWIAPSWNESQFEKGITYPFDVELTNISIGAGEKVTPVCGHLSVLEEYTP